MIFPPFEILLLQYDINKALNLKQVPAEREYLIKRNFVATSAGCLFLNTGLIAINFQCRKKSPIEQKITPFDVPRLNKYVKYTYI